MSVESSLERFVCFLRENSAAYSGLDAAAVSVVYETWSSLTGETVPGWDNVQAESVVQLLTAVPDGSEVELNKAGLLRSVATVQPPVGLSDDEELSPLRGWRFDGVLRKYQADVLARIVEPSAPKEGNLYRSLHIVAPPGSGKTVLGLSLAGRSGRRALILSPTLVVKDQWVREAGSFVGASPEVCSDGDRVGDVNVLTYQMLSVVSGENPFLLAGRELWVEELVEAGSHSMESADLWLEQLERQNSAVYRKGVRSRAGRLRRNRDGLRDISFMEKVLHPNAVSLVHRLADAGVETVVLDECHHLLVHWAFVVHYLLQVIKARGGDPLLIGLTATYPSFDGDKSFENYTSLLGDTDYEVPTPAVVKAGNLAPYASFVWFCEPTAAERKFVKNHSREVSQLVSQVFDTVDGFSWLMRQLVPSFPDVRLSDVDKDVGESYASLRSDKGLYHLDRVSSMLAGVSNEVVAEAGTGEVYKAVLKVSPRMSALTVVDELLVLSFYALDEVLPDPSQRPLWDKIRSMLQDYGYYLTDKGVRQGRNPAESVLAHSVSKDAAAVQILRLEEDSNAVGLVKAVVVTDFAVHGNSRGGDSSVAAGGALRTFRSLCDDMQVRAMNPVLITSKHFWVVEEEASGLTAAVEDYLRLERGALPYVPVSEAAGIVEVSLDSVGSGASILKALRGLVDDGTVRVIVGTRGLLGEGWDNPHVNTLIDLTTTATSSSVQQLRGRTLRLDSSWDKKVAHNWTVACVMRLSENPSGGVEVGRLVRKQSHVLSLNADVSNDTIVRGLPAILTTKQSGLVEKYLNGSSKIDKVSIAAVNAETVGRFAARDKTYDRWRVGEPYRNVEETVTAVSSGKKERSFFGGYTLAAVLGLLGVYLGLTVVYAAAAVSRAGGWSSWLTVAVLFSTVSVAFGWQFFPLIYKMFKSLAQPLTYYRGACEALIASLRRIGLISEDVSVSNLNISEESGEVYMGLVGVSETESELFGNCLIEMFAGDVSFNPRFLIEVGGSGRLGSLKDKKLQAANKSGVLIRMLSLLNRKPHYVPVPSVIARRKDEAVFFFQKWRKSAPYMTLREVRITEDRQYITAYRKQSTGRNRSFTGGAVLRSWK